MKKKARLIVALLLTFILTFQGVLYADLDVDKQVQTKKVMVKFKDDNDSLETKYKDSGIKKVKKLNKKGVYIVETDERNIKKLKNDKNVEFVEEDAAVKKSDDNITWNVDMVKSPELHRQNYNGQGIKVAVFDTGIDTSNSDLSVKGGVSFVDGVTDYTDDNGHGTAIAGIIGAVKNNEGLLGIAPEVELYSIKVLDEDGQGTYSNIIQGIEWAIENDMDIISMSLGGTQYSGILKDAINEATKNNILVVAASGNEGKAGNIEYPAKFNNVICVGAIDRDYNLADFTNYGAEMDLVAPGTDIETIGLNNSTINISGTSAAVPHVVGIAAQLWSIREDLTNTQLKALLLKSALPLGESKMYGWGMVNALQSLDNINENFELTEEPEDWAEINEVDTGTGGLVRFSYIIGPETQTITVGSRVTVAVGFYEAHSRAIITTYNVNNPSRILHTETQSPILANSLRSYTCPSNILNTPGTYNIRYHAQNDSNPSWNSDGRWDDVFTVYVISEDTPPDPDPTDDYGNDFGVAKLISVGSTKSARIDYDDDVDFFKFTPATSGTYVIQSTGYTDVKVDLYNSNHTFLKTSDDEAGYPNFKLEYNLQANQTYYLAISGFETGPYSFSVNKAVVSDDHGDTFASATLVPLNNTVNGNINYIGDHDYFKFTTTVAGNYTIESSGSSDVYAELYDNNYVYINENDDGGVGTNFLLNEPLLANKTYYVMVKYYDDSDTGTYSIKVTPQTGKPDLEVTDITWSPVSPTEGDGVTFSAVVKNNGNAATPVGTSLSVAFYIDNTNVTWARGYTTSIPVGGTVTLTANGGPNSGNNKWTAVSGTHTVKAYVDDLNAVAESDETDNQRSESITVNGLPDLYSSSISFEPEGLVAGGEKVKIKATIENNGRGKSTEGFDVEFKVMGGLGYQFNMQTLYGYCNEDISSNTNGSNDYAVVETTTDWIPQTGDYKIVVNVNYKHSIKEVSYQNNISEYPIEVGANDYYEPYNNDMNGATKANDENTGRIHDPSDVDWYYYNISNANKFIRVSLDCPGYTTEYEYDDLNYDIALYDISGNLLNVQDGKYVESARNSLVYKITTPGKYYIRVYSHAEPGDNPEDSSDYMPYRLKISLFASDIPYGSEAEGWSYLGKKVDASNTLSYRFGPNIMNSIELRSNNEKAFIETDENKRIKINWMVWNDASYQKSISKTIGEPTTKAVLYSELIEGYSQSYTYSTLERKGGASVWNDANIPGAPDPIFKYNKYSANTVDVENNGEKDYFAYARVYNNDTFDVVFNAFNLNESNLTEDAKVTYKIGGITDYPEFNMARAITAHELGHVLGLKDLYVKLADGYPNPSGGIIDNTDKIMYGFSGAENRLDLQKFLHRRDIIGAQTIQGWSSTAASLSDKQGTPKDSVIYASYVEYSNEDLYNKSDIIVKGKIKAIQDYNSTNLDELFSSVILETDEYFKDTTGRNSQEIVFLQDGNSSVQFVDNSLFNVGDEVILFLEKTSSGKLIIAGGPQGRFDIIDTGTEVYIQNHLNKYVQEELEISGSTSVEPKFTPIEQFEQQVEEGIRNIAPIMTGETLTLPNENGWYKDNVTVHFTAVDTMYGIASISPDVTLSNEAAEQSVTGTATNSVGNQSTYTVSGINIDKTLPTIVAKKSAEQNSFGWYNKPITIHFEAVDNLSGIYYVDPDITVETQGVTSGLIGKAVDMAGNETTVALEDIKLDTIAPVIEAQPNMNDWNSKDIAVTPLCKDENGSGIKVIQYSWTRESESPSSWTNYASGDILQQTDGVWYLNVKAEDFAGNISQVRFGAYRLDKTLPVLGASPQSKDWTNTAIQVQPSYLDGAGSQIKESYYQWSTGESDSTNWALFNGGMLEQGNEGVWYLYMRAVDFAGNENIGKFGPYSIDKTKPEGSVSIEARDWDNEPITVQVNYEDKGGSELNPIEYSWSASETQPSNWEKTDNGTIQNSNDGIWFLFLKVTDKAGNETLTKFGPYKLDKVSPKVQANPTQRTWDIDEVKVTPAITDDNGSGIASTMYNWSKEAENPNQWMEYKGGELGVSEEGSWYLYIKAVDIAGNETLEKFGPYMIDKTVPAVTVNLSSKEWTNTDIIVIPTATDNLSGVDKVSFKWSDTMELPKGWDLYNGTSIIATQTGIWYLHIKATDKAGNFNIVTFGPYKIDKVAPTSDVDLKERDWMNVDAAIKATYSDEGGSQVSIVEYTWGTDSSVSIDWNPYKAEGIVQSMDGAWDLYIKVTDTAGNETITKYGPYKVDKTSPEINSDPASTEWTKDSVRIRPDIVDYYSGIDTKEYQLNMQNTPDSNWLNYENQALELNETGVWYLHIRAKDNAGNTKVMTFGPYRIDKIAPTVDAMPENVDWMNRVLKVDAVFSDNGGSGVFKTQYSWTEIETSPGAWIDTISDTIEQSEDGVWYLYLRVTDTAGNETIKKFGPYMVDRTKPVITHSLKDDYFYKDSLNLKFEAQDNLSGIKETYVNVNGVTMANGADIILDKPGSNKIEFVAVDVAGNIETVTKMINVIVAANMDFEPKSVNLKNSDKDGSVVTVYIELPAELTPNEILIDTIRLNDIVSPITDPKQGYVKNPVADYDGDGILEFMVKIEKNSLNGIFMAGSNNVIIKGNTGTYSFTASYVVEAK